MKFAIPEISWHNRDPVLSADFQPRCEDSEPLRLATGGTDSHILIWYISITESGSVNLEVAADLTRHQKAVNVVRWSPDGQFLASGDDESIIFIWKQKTDKEPPVQNLEQPEEQYKESWVIHKTLRGHMEDILDISWSRNSAHLASGSVDNKLLVWDVARGRYSSILSDHKGFVQGVSWDPQGQLIASASTDRVFRTFDVNTKKVVSRSSKAVLPFPSDHPLKDVKVRLYHDDTLQTFYRRLQFSPDGLLIAVPAGRIEPEQGKVDVKPINAVYIYTRYSLKVPACILPCGEAALVTRWSPRRYAPRDCGPRPAFPLSARMVLAIATKRAVMLYDTQQKTPIALISNIHYARLTDLTWSPDGRILVASSADGFCSVITFSDGELGEVLPEDDTAPQTSEPMEVEVPEQPQNAEMKEKTPEKESKPSSNLQKIDSFIKFKAPPQNSSKNQKIVADPKTPVKIDVLEEVAMPSWSDNSNNELIKPQEPMEVENETNEKVSEVIQIEDSEDIKLVYEDTESKLTESLKETETSETRKKSPKKSPKLKSSPQNALKIKRAQNSPQSNKLTSKQSPKNEAKVEDNNFFKQAKVTDIKEPVSVTTTASPKVPRRVNFVTLSSPKNKKKC
ncbi:chromatin assembly factor 1 subunit B [Galleria mellonella]|uniref:Chromatin assembly factor 1 subunit B n=1 Tax=Galleria mellonella TaxID=7137 RepID=A0A6J1WFV1_GALME|nr:chromatin assembly factor 1 subunit B [Galleria mellonella]